MLRFMDTPTLYYAVVKKDPDGRYSATFPDLPRISATNLDIWSCLAAAQRSLQFWLTHNTRDLPQMTGLKELWLGTRGHADTYVVPVPTCR